MAFPVRDRKGHLWGHTLRARELERTRDTAEEHVARCRCCTHMRFVAVQS